MSTNYSYFDDKKNLIQLLDLQGNILPLSLFPKLRVVFTGDGGGKVTIINPKRINSCTILCGTRSVISLGNNCDIVGSLKIFASASDSIVSIGKQCSFSGVDIRLQSEPNLSVIIGDRCLFSSNITIRASDSHTVFDLNTNVPINVPTSIVLGNHIWCGFGVDILKNSVISSNCVVGARALVSGQFTKENCVIAGVPAKIIKTEINWSWENTYNYIKNNSNNIHTS